MSNLSEVPFQLSPVVQLNVGGHLYTTTLSTLRRYPDSRLAELFSGKPKLHTDAEGRFFIDRDGFHFRAILEFLRSDLLPTEDIQKVGPLRGGGGTAGLQGVTIVAVSRSTQRRCTTTSKR